jgi:hypothetical protein
MQKLKNSPSRPRPFCGLIAPLPLAHGRAFFLLGALALRGDADAVEIFRFQFHRLNYEGWRGPKQGGKKTLDFRPDCEVNPLIGPFGAHRSHAVQKIFF